MRIPASNKCRGFTLLEISLVITVALIIVGIGLGAWKVTRGSSASYSTGSAILEITGGIRSLYPTSDYAGLSTASLIAANAIPSGLLHSSGVVALNGWGGQLTVSAASIGAGTNNAYVIQTYGVPTDGCNRVISAVQEQFRKITVGASILSSTIVKDETSATKVPYASGTTSAACQNPSNIIALYSQ